MSAGSRRVRTAGPGGPAESENVGAETPGVRRLSGFGLGHIICMRIFGDFLKNVTVLPKSYLTYLNNTDRKYAFKANSIRSFA